MDFTILIDDNVALDLCTKYVAKADDASSDGLRDVHAKCLNSASGNNNEAASYIQSLLNRTLGGREKSHSETSVLRLLCYPQ